MAVGYKITDKEFKRLWLVLSKDSFVCNENLTIIEQICRKNGIDDDSMSYFSVNKLDWDEVFDLVLTPSFFGERLIVIRDGDITALNDTDFENPVYRHGDHGDGFCLYDHWHPHFRHTGIRRADRLDGADTSYGLADLCQARGCR